ncbi:hypothetical protein P9X10_02735 [Bacillus cereus]|nr:hypothetical protein [Bacillus cereus]
MEAPVVNEITEVREQQYAEDGDFFKGVAYASFLSIHFYGLLFGIIRLVCYN